MGSEWLMAMIVCFFLGSVVPLFLGKTGRASSLAAYGFALGASFMGLLSGFAVLLGGKTVVVELPRLFPFTTLSLRMDGLAAVFVFVISLVSFAVAIFSFGYVREYQNKRNLALLGAAYNVFVLSMILVVTANNLLLFFMFWEIMTLVSFFMVTLEHEKSKSRRAGFVYIVMTHLGTAFILFGFFLLAKFSGSLVLSDFRQVGAQLTGGVKDAVFLLTLIGFSTKAGVIPLHLWLPLAHPAAPSNISALMSGVMIKTAIYGILRVCFDFLAPVNLWWGVVILILGVVSALLGVMYALMQHNLKRLLAYHSVENIGIILIGVGGAVIFAYFNAPALAALSLTAGLYHLVNHAVFKGLLFLGAGSVHYAVHTKNIERLGGLIKRMPWTAFFFLIGAISISALPPFNGFVSEWLTFQSLIMLGINVSDLGIKITALLGGAMLALTGALAAACFVKAFGICFLALPRSPEAARAKEVPCSMKLGMGVLSALCLAFGVMPAFVSTLFLPVTRDFLDTDIAGQLAGTGWLAFAPLDQGFAAVANPVLVLLLAALVLTGWGLVYLLGGKTRTRVDETWTCGISPTAEMEYTATSFAQPIRTIFKKIFVPGQQVDVRYNGAPYFPHSIKYQGYIKPVFELYLYRPVMGLVLKVSGYVRKIQTGSTHAYLSYILITLVLLLLFAR